MRYIRSMTSELPKDSNGNYSWVEYRRLVLSEISDLKINVKAVREEQVKIKLDIRDLKTKSTVWGGIAGFVVGLIVTIVGWAFF